MTHPGHLNAPPVAPLSLSDAKHDRAALALFDGPGEMRALCLTTDWGATPLGPVSRWSQSLRTTVGLVLGSRNPMFLFWGPDHVQFFNDAYRPSLGHAGRHLRALGARGREFWTEIWEVIGPQIDQVMTTGEPTWHEDHYLPIERNGRLDDVWWTYSYSAVRDDDGSIGGTLVVCQETTNRVLAAREIERLLAERIAAESERERLFQCEQQARAAAEAAYREVAAANRTKSEFLASMSHELRTPLNAIGGYAQLLEVGVHGPLTDAQREMVGRIHRSGKHLLSLINDVLNFAKLEAGKVEYDTQDVALDAVAEEVLAMLEPQIAASGIACVIDVAPGVIARADPEKVRQILLNLLSNAVKFTPAGGRIAVDVPRGTPARPGVVFVRVSDTGCGIPPEKHEAIFDPFVQVHRHLTRNTEGTGLGLAISRDLARGMGGDLRVRSVEDQGTAFTLTLPAAHADG